MVDECLFKGNTGIKLILSTIYMYIYTHTYTLYFTVKIIPHLWGFIWPPCTCLFHKGERSRTITWRFFRLLTKKTKFAKLGIKKGDLSRDSGLILAWLWGGLKMGGEGGLFAFASFPPSLFSQKYVLSPKKYILIQISVVMLLRLL